MEPKLRKKREQKKQRVTQNALAREIDVLPRDPSRIGLQLTLSPLAEAPVQATTDVHSHPEVIHGVICNSSSHTPNETQDQRPLARARVAPD
jgi:hypothetical protein